MIENSSAGLEMLESEVTVTVTREEHHQSVLARYPVVAGAQRHVAVELGWCTISSGKYRGQPAVEVRLDGHRVGELTHAMSQRYGSLVSQVAFRGGKPGCEAVIQRGVKGLEVLLRLPRHADGIVPAVSDITGPPLTPPSVAAPGLASVTTPMAPVTAPSAPPRQRGVFSSHRPAWITAAVIAILFIAILASNHDSSPTAKPQTQLNASITTPITTTVSAPAYTRPTTISATTASTVAAAPEPTTSQPPSPPTRKATTPQAPAPPPAPAPAPATEEPAPRPACDPNYSGCVPVASDVDCAGGSGDGPAYVRGPIRVTGSDIYDLDRDGDGIACE